MVAEFLLGASSTGKLATSLSPAAGREQTPLGDALQLAGAEHLPYAAGSELQYPGGLIDAVEVLLHMDSIPVLEAFAPVLGAVKLVTGSRRREPPYIPFCCTPYIG
jgi:hypothetical protein